MRCLYRKEVTFKKSARVITDTGKSKICGVAQQAGDSELMLQFQSEGLMGKSSLLSGISLLILVRPSTDWARTTHDYGGQLALLKSP